MRYDQPGRTGLLVSELCLCTGYIDLCQLHGFDPLTPVEETMRASTTSYARAWCAMSAVAARAPDGWSRRAASQTGRARFESLRAYCTLAGRDLERDIVSMLNDQKMGLLVWSPLAGGLLSGKVGRDQAAPDGSRRAMLPFPLVDEAHAFDRIDAMRPIAAAVGKLSAAEMQTLDAVSALPAGYPGWISAFTDPQRLPA